MFHPDQHNFKHFTIILIRSNSASLINGFPSFLQTTEIVEISVCIFANFSLRKSTALYYCAINLLNKRYLCAPNE